MEQNVYTPEDKYYDYPDRPVPQNKRKSPINIAVVTTGMAVAMSTLYTGSALAEVMSFKDGTNRHYNWWYNFSVTCLINRRNWSKSGYFYINAFKSSFWKKRF